jgi:hypothetical protein
MDMGLCLLGRSPAASSEIDMGGLLQWAFDQSGVRYTDTERVTTPTVECKAQQLGFLREGFNPLFHRPHAM